MTFSPEKKMAQPFKDLDRLLKEKKIPLKSEPPPRTVTVAPAPALTSRQESELFKAAMADVTPLSFDRHRQPPKRHFTFTSFQDDDARETIESLDRLIESGQGFTVADTAEYMEATAPGVGDEIARRLHSGHYSVQDHVDLHGLTAREADEVLHAFMHKAIRDGKRAVLVIHGRGLTSPCKPVLKHKVYLWLTRGPLRKHVIALTSARSCDGGAGATYVLLRRRPLTSSMRKAAYRKLNDTP